ncbi:MAG: exo-alpha-sialidase [Spirochaetia bacterium]|jgi:hypothetical protein|nr:exo-alpha-sialidase [Spirochaetia bacterium]
MRFMDEASINKARKLARRLIDPARATIAIPAERSMKGYWFGGGSMAQGPDGRLYLSGRYRSAGDSRTGLDLGDRGRELAIFASDNDATSWTKVTSLDKSAVAPDGEQALSIEGSALRFTDKGVELFVSSEKPLAYPAPVTAFQKPGTGVWSIDRLWAPDIGSLHKARARTILSTMRPEIFHIKDPFLAARADGGSYLFFCHHPYCWSSSGTGYLVLGSDGEPIGNPVYDCYPRGPAWDVAITRATCTLPLPDDIGPAGSGLVFYDGGECLRNLDEHAQAKTRPRGYSCEELGGLGYYMDKDPTSFRRISDVFPEFISPDGSGCLRYVDVLETADAYIATWQQSRPDGSQPLMINRVKK